MDDLKILSKKLLDMVNTAIEKKIDINISSKTNLDYSKNNYYANQINATILQLRKRVKESESCPPTIVSIVAELDSTDLVIIKKLTQQLLKALETSPVQKQKKEPITTSPKSIPKEIKEELLADITEMEKCYAAGCYRSVIILCGRIIEIGLHRIYFQTTGQDILETNPGIGLGTLIGKLNEKNVTFEPGLAQQIHLVNQVRIFSVHKKQDPFYPSKAQAQAMMLYTMDTISKLFP